MHNAVIMLKTLSKLASGLQLHCPKGLGKLLLLRRQGGNSILELLSQLKLSSWTFNGLLEEERGGKKHKVKKHWTRSLNLPWV